jgi:hypothetical protein
MSSLMSLMGPLPCAAVAFGFAALLAFVDVRTGRGYALGAVSLLHLVTTIFVVGIVAIAAQEQPKPITRQHGSVTIWLVFYFVPSVYIILITMIGAVVVAGIARRWLWIVGFIMAGAVPFLVAALPYAIWDLNTEFIVRQAGFLGVLLAPEATILTYSITRLVHPLTPAPARQPVPIS